MNRRRHRLGLLLAPVATTITTAAGSQAPSATLPTVTATERIERARDMLRAAGIGRRCRDADPDDAIVICAQVDDADLPTEPPLSDPVLPRELGAPPAGKGIGLSLTVPVGILQGRPRPPMPDISFSTFALPPPGSDSDRIARGEVRAD